MGTEPRRGRLGVVVGGLAGGRSLLACRPGQFEAFPAVIQIQTALSGAVWRLNSAVYGPFAVLSCFMWMLFSCYSVVCVMISVVPSYGVLFLFKTIG